MTLLTNAYVVVMDDAGTEHERGWIRLEDGLVTGVGEGDPPEPGEDLRGALVTPALVNTHHHLYQTLTRARAQQAGLFAWLRELYPVWAGIDAEAEYAAARTGLAELALSGCGTVFDHHYVFPRGRDGLIEAEPSTPSPTRTPASTSSRVRATPAPSRRFDVGQCATPTPVAANVATSASDRWTQCAHQTSPAVQPSSVRYSTGVHP